MTAPIPESVLRETVEVCKRAKALLRPSPELQARAADPSHGMEAMAEELLRIRQQVAEMDHELFCHSRMPFCRNCGEIEAGHVGGECSTATEEIRRIFTAGDDRPCNCIKSRIGKATGKDSLQVQGKVKQGL